MSWPVSMRLVSHHKVNVCMCVCVAVCMALMKTQSFHRSADRPPNERPLIRNLLSEPTVVLYIYLFICVQLLEFHISPGLTLVRSCCSSVSLENQLRMRSFFVEVVYTIADHM
jgi:hypothetical protein